MPNALITGITGQDGLYLSELLLDKGYTVYGLIRGQNNPKLELVERTVPDVKLLGGDLTDIPSLLRALEVSRPDEVYNLGAISYVAYSWDQALLTSEVTGARCAELAGGNPGSRADSRAGATVLPSVVIGNVRQGSSRSAE